MTPDCLIRHRLERTLSAYSCRLSLDGMEEGSPVTRTRTPVLGPPAAGLMGHGSCLLGLLEPGTFFFVIFFFPSTSFGTEALMEKKVLQTTREGTGTCT